MNDTATMDLGQEAQDQLTTSVETAQDCCCPWKARIPGQEFAEKRGQNLIYDTRCHLCNQTQNF